MIGSLSKVTLITVLFSSLGSTPAHAKISRGDIFEKCGQIATSTNELLGEYYTKMMEASVGFSVDRLGEPHFVGMQKLPQVANSDQVEAMSKATGDKLTEVMSLYLRAWELYDKEIISESFFKEISAGFDKVLEAYTIQAAYFMYSELLRVPLANEEEIGKSMARIKNFVEEHGKSL